MEHMSEKTSIILQSIVCPECKGDIKIINTFNIVCNQCGRQYSIINGIPDMISKDFNNTNRLRIETESSFFDEYGFKKEDYQVYEKNEYNRILDLMDLKKISTEESILSIGCGSGVFEEILGQRGYTVWGIDLSMNLLAKCPFPVVRADCMTLPFHENQFKHVICAGVLHHVPPDLHSHVLQEIHRILQPNGHFYAFEPKTTFRSHFLHPISQVLGMRTKGEEPIPFEMFKIKAETTFSETEFRFIREVQFVDLSPLNKKFYTLIKFIFNLIPYTDKNDFFIVISWK